MTTSRYNFYTIIHKGIRHELGELLRLGAGTDFAGPEAAAYVARLRASIHLMNEHALHEDHHVEPLLERFAPPLVRLRGIALMGSVTVHRQPAPGTPKKYLGTY